MYIVSSNSTKNIPGLLAGADVYLSVSQDRGNSFAAPVGISDDNTIKTVLAAQQKSLSFGNSFLAASGTHVYIAWGVVYPDSPEIFFRASDDGGRTFGKITSLNEATDEPVSRGFAVLSSSATYITVIAGIIVAGTLGVLIVKHRRAIS